MDAQEEQNQNLNDILGFDPSENSSEDSSSNNSKETLTPLQKAAQATGETPQEIKDKFEKSLMTAWSLYKDSVNLFCIRKTFSGIERTYFKYGVLSESSRDNFSEAIVTGVNMEGMTYAYEVRTDYEGSGSNTEKIYFFDGNAINIYKMISSERIVNVHYDKNGILISVEFGIFAGDANYGIRYDKKTSKYERSFRINEPLPSFDYHGKAKMSRQNHVEIPDMEFGIDKNGMVNISLSKNGQETDRFGVPEQIDPQKIKADMYPDELLKNPTNPDVNLDTGALQPPFARIGAKWDVLEEEKSSIPQVDDKTL